MNIICVVNKIQYLAIHTYRIFMYVENKKIYNFDFYLDATLATGIAIRLRILRVNKLSAKNLVYERLRKF